VSQTRNIQLTVLGLLLFIAVIVGGFIYRMTLPTVMSAAEMKINGLYLHETPRSIGDFELVDHRGESFGPARLKGHWSLLFFGFTYCPDICPTTMAFLNELVAKLDSDEAADTRVVMVSVDPARDTAEHGVYGCDRRVSRHPSVRHGPQYALPQGGRRGRGLPG
jgi:protein SCO1/2